jgi:hypothetical protein
MILEAPNPKNVDAIDAIAMAANAMHDAIVIASKQKL